MMTMTLTTAEKWRRDENDDDDVEANNNNNNNENENNKNNDNAEFNYGRVCVPLFVGGREREGRRRRSQWAHNFLLMCVKGIGKRE